MPQSPDNFDAERAYLFRHALMRAAAYELQLPSSRGELHALAVALIEDIVGDDTPPFAAELCVHAAAAGDAYRARHLHYAWQAAVFARDMHDSAGALAHFDVVVGHPLASDTQRFEALFEGASLLRLSGALDAALHRYESAAPLANTDLQHSRLMGEHAELYRERGDFAAAIETTRRSLELAEKSGDRPTIGTVHGKLATALHGTNRLDEAEVHYEAALAIHRDTGNRRQEGIVLGNRATLRHWQGRLDEAEREFNEALQIQTETGNERFRAVTMGNMASLYADLGQQDRARELLTESIRMNRALGSRRPLAAFLANLASRYVLEEMPDAARPLLHEAVALHREVGSRLGEMNALRALAVTELAYGELSHARAVADQALAIAETVTAPRDEAPLRSMLAKLAAREGNLELAEAEARRAVELYGQTERRGAQAAGYARLAVILRKLGRQAEAAAADASADQLADAAGAEEIRDIRNET